MLVPFKSPEKACAAVSAIFRAGYTPSAIGIYGKGCAWNG